MTETTGTPISFRHLHGTPGTPACTGSRTHVCECVHSDGHGDADVFTHHRLWSHLPAQPVPAQQLWDPLLPLLPVPAGDGLLRLPVLRPSSQSEHITPPHVCAHASHLTLYHYCVAMFCVLVTCC